MKRPFALRLATFVATVVVGLLFAAPAAVAKHGSSLDQSSIHPMVFVHGGTGVRRPIRVAEDALYGERISG